MTRVSEKKVNKSVLHLFVTSFNVHIFIYLIYVPLLLDKEVWSKISDCILSPIFSHVF